MSLYSKIIDLQKLSAAWQRVRRNKPAAGVDNITWQQFDENSRQELKNLQLELAEHTYMPLPVRNVTLYKGEKARKIALYSMRDKVVQQSLASEIMKLYDGRLSRQSYAYRSDKSALQAVEDISAEILTGAYNALLKTDITHFFDNISWDLLREKLYRTIREEDVLELIRLNSCTAMLDEETGEITEKVVGIHQGSSISPILSNIYLMDFDIALSRPEIFYVRYSDDILVLGENKEKLCTFLNEIKTRLEELRLSTNENKTLCCGLSEGVDFLGYHFDASGKSIPAKAEDRLHNRLETMWLTNPTLDVEEKAAKALEITGGWQQYYKGERIIQSIYEYIAFVFAVGGRKELIERLEQDRVKVENACKDIAEYLSLFWKKNERNCLELLEYEQYYGLPSREFQRPILNDSKVCSLLELYRKHFVLEEEGSSLELMQTYTDMQEYANAQYWMEHTDHLRSRKERLASLSRREGYAGSLAINIPDSKKEHLANDVKMKTGQEKREEDSTITTESDTQPVLSITRHTPLVMLETFAGRDDIYSIETSTGNQSRRTELQERPLTEGQIEEHLRGVNTIGTYIQRPNSTVRYIVWDVDISKLFILKYGSSGESFYACLQHAYHKALEIQKLLDDKGIHAYIEFSGYRGYHVWLFLSEWIPVRFANMLTDRIEEEIIREDDLTIECFPNKVRLKAGRLGQVLKIPCGMHVRSGRRSCFVDDDGQPVTELDNFVETLARYPLPDAELALTIYQNAKTREQQEKYDMATLLLYRLLEMISQRRLSRYGIFASRPDYRQVKYNVKKFDELKEMDGESRLGWLTNRYRNITEAVFRREPDRLLPAPIASLDGFILLAALGDPLVGNGKLSESVSMIKRIRSMVYLRNNSIFAHGLGPVNHKDYFKFRSFVFEMFRSFCSIEKIDFDESERFVAWINPMLSANYTRAIR